MDLLKPFVFFFLIAAPFGSFAQNLGNTKNVRTEKVLALAEIKNYALFYFWATWCPDCREKITRDLGAYSGANFELVGIATDKDLGKIQDYLKQNDVKIPVFYDSEKTLQKHFKVFSVPTLVLARKTPGGLEPLKTLTGKDWSEIDKQLPELAKKTGDL